MQRNLDDDSPKLSPLLHVPCMHSHDLLMTLIRPLTPVRRWGSLSGVRPSFLPHACAIIVIKVAVHQFLSMGHRCPVVSIRVLRLIDCCYSFQITSVVYAVILSLIFINSLLKTELRLCVVSVFIYLFIFIFWFGRIQWKRMVLFIKK